MAKIAIFPEIRLFMYFNRGPKPSASISRRRTSRPFRKAAGSKLFGDQQYRVISQRDLSLGVPEAVAVSGSSKSGSAPALSSVRAGSS